MGEARFYLKAEKINGIITKQEKEYIEDIVSQLGELEAKWQEVRNQKGSVLKRVAKLQEAYPDLVKDFLSNVELNEQDNLLNDMAGDFPTLDPHDLQLDIGEKEIRLDAMEWHLASWDKLANWFKRKGYKCGWVSDEYLDAYMCIDLNEGENAVVENDD